MFLRIQDFDLEYDGTCANDYDTLSIYDDNYANPERLIGVFCGEVYPETVTSTGENMFVVFKSDNSIEARGFQAAYYFLPGKRTTQTTQQDYHIRRCSTLLHSYREDT